MERGVERDRVRALQDLREKLAQMQMGVTTKTQMDFGNLANIGIQARGMYGQYPMYPGMGGYPMASR